MLDVGFIKIHRKSIHSDIWKKPPIYWKVWSYILMKAYFEDTDGLKQGELIVTYDELIDACSYYRGYVLVKPKKSEIRKVLDYLRRTHEGTTKVHTKDTMIDTTKVKNGLLIKVLNYRLYQTFEEHEGHSEGHNEGTHERTTKGQKGAQLYNKKNIKEEKRKRISSSSAPSELGRGQPSSLSIPSYDEVEQYIQEKGYRLKPKHYHDMFMKYEMHDAKGNVINHWKRYLDTCATTDTEQNAITIDEQPIKFNFAAFEEEEG